MGEVWASFSDKSCRSHEWLGFKIRNSHGSESWSNLSSLWILLLPLITGIADFWKHEETHCTFQLTMQLRWGIQYLKYFSIYWHYLPSRCVYLRETEEDMSRSCLQLERGIFVRSGPFCSSLKVASYSFWSLKNSSKGFLRKAARSLAGLKRSIP